ncbi:hypothetical protein ACFQVC_22020 [Streptomyces monticola]|uniref:Uncharacterized protein n=1 Tax=Streptomyces monticola TaxID=2666263 RepID=A0ABW2JNH5_9ACTN
MRGRHREVFGTLIAALCTLLAFVLATDTAAAHPGGETRAGDPAPVAAAAPEPQAAPSTAPAAASTASAAASAASTPPQVPDARPQAAVSVPGDHRGPFDDCRHRRATRASVAAPAPQPESGDLCGAVLPSGRAASAPAVPRCTTEAVPPRPGERQVLLQIFRC